ncbi:glycine--tRNA ligase subunit beta [Wolbachia endosymbiont of Chironomus riparius]|uniref:glycine--tRNA ligase subunit beta n=1 Tax=Wolbachia endosymbiont of Chironomus riparius TaxID=2883238 RepID=UPI0020A1DACC|nr:glycine--tRNA ligase subunit beta [Wolbachia endosymbiont of Chironomus riparius]
MPSQLLFECLSEEIPPRMHTLALEQVKNYVTNIFSKNSIKFVSIEVFITARRIAFFVDNISCSETNDSKSEIKGPNVNTARSALDGFLKKNQKSEESLFIRKVNNEDFYFIKKDNSSFNIKEFLKNQLEEMLKNFSWPKSMRWGITKERWIRPIKSILCILNGEIIPLSFAGITASNVTCGHRIFSKEKILTIKTPQQYFELLKENNVILEQNKRKSFILDQIHEFTANNGLQLEENDYLLNELTGLIEWPVVLFGKVNQEKSSGLPKEVILSIIHTQQKYLALSNGQKVLYFVTVVSVSNDNVIAGYEKILEARLADAKFLISQDKKHNLDYYVNKLDSILFHASLGSIGEKVKRIKALSKYIAIWIPHASLIKVERTAHLAKADLATSIVREFPELQGIMGGYYANYFQEDKEVVESIIDHYKPVGAKLECPTSPSTVTVSIADKIDSLVGLIGAGEKISGSYDHFGLRRISIGIIRVIIENDIHIPIKLLIDKSISLYSRFTSNKDSISINKLNKLNRKKISELIFKFCLERFKVILKNKNIKPDVINSILCKNNIDDLLTAEKQIVILNQYLNGEEGKQVIEIYKRISNIVKKAEKNDKIIRIPYSKRLLTENEEVNLSNYLTNSSESIKQAIKNNHFNLALNELLGFVPLVNQFMNSVKINCDSHVLRRNRLSLLDNTVSIFHSVADFSLIQIK